MDMTLAKDGAPNLRVAQAKSTELCRGVSQGSGAGPARGDRKCPLPSPRRQRRASPAAGAA
eukprot:2750278-Pyramimonas_sp.AAC.1